jgi:hypothetical protein
MTDPKRWADEEGLVSNEERALLQAGRDETMPRALRERVWLGVAAGTAATAAPVAAAALQKGIVGKSAMSLLTGAIGKGVLAVALVGGAGIGVWAVRSPTRLATRANDTVSIEPGTMVTSPAPHVDDVAAPMSASSSLDPANATPRARTGNPTRSTARTAGSEESREASRLREESSALLAARKELLSGNAAGALRMLDRARVEFPNGALAEDREALTVRALVESGQKDAARSRGESFLRAFPRSPYAAEVRAILAR